MSTTSLPTPQFIERDPLKIVSEMKAMYEEETGKVLQPGQPEMLILNGMAYREALIRSQIQDASVQNLTNFAIGNMLDFLADLVGVERLAASSARCTLLFTMVEGHTGVTIPANTRVQSIDGKVNFITLVDTNIDTGIGTVEITAECTSPGTIGNNYLVNDISVQLDPYAYVASAVNTATTGGGADQEVDDEFRERIKLAPNSFSVAGPELAYAFFAKSASVSIIDVGVDTVTAGQVDIYPLVADGSVTSEEVLGLVRAVLNNKKVRPLCDTPVVSSPDRVEYSLTIELTLLPDAVEDDVLSMVEEAVEEFTIEKRSKLGRDIIGNQIKALCMIKDSVYDVDLPGFTDLVIDNNQFAFCTEITVTVEGTNEG